VVYTDAMPAPQIIVNCYGCGEQIGIIINHKRKVPVDLKPRRYGQYALLADGVRAFDLEAEDVSEQDRLMDTPRFVKHSLVCPARGFSRVSGLRYGKPTPAELGNEAIRQAKLKADQERG
jgi:hypothetical protein